MAVDVRQENKSCDLKNTKYYTIADSRKIVSQKKQKRQKEVLDDGSNRVKLKQRYNFQQTILVSLLETIKMVSLNTGWV